MASVKDTRTSSRGFASMDEERQREIARKGGRSVPADRRSFSKNSDLASWAGRKGGQSVPAKERTFSKNPALAAAAGRKGGQASGASRSRGPATVDEEESRRASQAQPGSFEPASERGLYSGEQRKREEEPSQNGTYIDPRNRT